MYALGPYQNLNLNFVDYCLAPSPARESLPPGTLLSSILATVQLDRNCLRTESDPINKRLSRAQLLHVRVVDLIYGHYVTP
jgi:hypothetical protein